MNPITPEDLLDQIEHNWTKSDVSKAMRGLRDLSLRLDKKRELRHHILLGDKSASITVTLTEDKDLAEFLIYSMGEDASTSSINLVLTKKQIDDLAVFLYYTMQKPKEIDV